jgi:hypothetical protein
VRLPHFSHVVVVVFENHEASSIAGSSDAPTFNALARRYGRLTNYDAVAHPSLPNYLALVSGSTQGISSDCTDCVVGARSLADTLEVAGKTWKTYAEDLPYPGFTGGSDGRYAKKHDPFLYFRDVADSRARRDRVVPFPQLGGGGRIEALALSPTVRRGSSFAKATNHYGLLRTIEDAWGLPRLGYSGKGTPVGGIWRR